MRGASEGSAPMLIVHWIINTQHGQETLVFGLASTHGTHAHTSHSSPLGSVCAVLPSDSSSSLFSHPLFLPPLYLLRCVYLTHSSQRGNKLALSNNLTDNYSQTERQRGIRTIRATGLSPLLSPLLLPHCFSNFVFLHSRFYFFCFVFHHLFYVFALCFSLYFVMLKWSYVAQRGRARH